MDKFENAITDEVCGYISEHEAMWRETGGRTDGLPELTRATMGLAYRIIDINRQRPDGIGKEIIGDTLKLLCYKYPAAPTVTLETLAHDERIRDKRKKFYALRRRCDGAMMLWDMGREGIESTRSRIVVECTLMPVAECEITTRVLAFTGRNAHKKLKAACTDCPGTYHIYDHLTFWNFWEDVDQAIQFAEELAKKTGIPLGKLLSDSDGAEILGSPGLDDNSGDHEEEEDKKDEKQPPVKRENKGYKQIHDAVRAAIERNGGAGKAKTIPTHRATVRLLKRKKFGRGFSIKQFLINLGCCGYANKDGVIVKKGKVKT